MSRNLQKCKYEELLRMDAWQVKRQEILDRDESKCQKCGQKGNQVHHTFYYDSYTPPWRYPNESMITLCHQCHEKEHQLHGKIYKSTPITTESNKNATCHDKDIYLFIAKDGKYKIGNFKITSKPGVVKLARCLLSKLPVGTPITDKDIVAFVHDLYQYHPEKMEGELDGFVTTENDSTGNYTNFKVFFKDGGYHQFSNNRCADNIPAINIKKKVMRKWRR